MAYRHFIPQNIAPKNIRRISVYDSNDNRVGQIPLDTLEFPDVGEKQYSFGALSDVHITQLTATEDFQRALTYLNDNEDVSFTCICGDLTDNGTAEQLAQYKAVVDAYSSDTPVYAISGNHEGSKGWVTTESIQPYTGQPLYYSFTQGDDLFIMCGEATWWSRGLFEQGQLTWLYETLEENRNKRCFVFFHVFPWGDREDRCDVYCGNACEIYETNLFFNSEDEDLEAKQGEVFQSLMEHYKNVILFHGHSHLKFDLQEIDDKANFSNALGFKSVHIPSLAVPRDGTSVGADSKQNIFADSEGYVVDVYKNGVHLRGRDFIKSEFLPIASYWLDTTLIEVEANTYDTTLLKKAEEIHVKPQ